MDLPASTNAEGVRENLAATRWLIAPFVVLAGAGAFVLYLFPRDTDALFAWTLRPPLSAMFMGAGYAAGVLLTVLSYRRQPWAVTRTATLTILVFVAVMTAATFLHLDKMHFDAAEVTAQFAAWAWLVVYVVVPPLLLAIIVAQSRQPGVDPPRLHPLPVAVRAALALQGLALLSLGVALFGWPESMDGVWPWAITELSGRALSAWIVAIGFASLWVTYENDLRRTRPAAMTSVALGALWLLAAIRDADSMRWERASAWIYVVGAALAVSVGLWGWSLSRGAVGSEG
ncbi:MAG TPA: hypothetical protein VLG28_00790 [Acidimicrobiia bacterium]|nr:hypothetical protein [Acidimicrobiia bacterium]